jgi:hypothetical protein
MCFVDHAVQLEEEVNQTSQQKHKNANANEAP